MIEDVPDLTQPTPEKEHSPEWHQLRELEASGLYVFHGTRFDGEALEPRQAIDTAKGPDDVPGIHASQVVDYAIFMAVAAPLGHSRAGCFGKDSNGSLIMDYGIEKAIQERLTDTTHGYVYVFKREDFKQRHAAEWLATKPLIPVMKIRVSKKDLPENISVF